MLGVLMLLVVGAALVYGLYTILHQPIEAGQFKISDTFLGENLHDSLDLNVADKATYPSDPIKITNQLGPNDGVLVDEFSFVVKDDNLTEYGLLTLPSTPQPASGYPVVVLLHGFSSPRDYRTDTFYFPDMAFYSKHGFAVFKPDYRGQGLSLKAGHSNSAYYSMDYNTDVLSLISALKQTSLVDKANISVWGHSMGAYIGLRAAVLSPDIKNLILLAGPVDSLSKMYATYLPPSDARDAYALATRNQVFSKYHTPNHDQFWTDASPINFVSKIKARVQINVGSSDKTVSPVFSADLDAALSRAHITHQYFVYPDGTHSLAIQRPDIWNHSLALLMNGF